MTQLSSVHGRLDSRSDILREAHCKLAHLEICEEKASGTIQV